MARMILAQLVEIAAYSAVVFLAVALFRTAFRRWLSPAACYALWFLVVLRLIVPVTVESGFHPFALPEAATATAWQSPMDAALPAAAGVGGEAGGALPNGGAAPAQNAPMPQAGTTGTANAGVRRGLPEWLLLLWGAGALAVLGVSAAMQGRLSARIRARSAGPGKRLRGMYAELRHAMGIRRNVPLRLMPDIASPALTAGLRPVLLLPDAFADGLPDEALRFSLAHELTHYRRGDHLVCLLLVLLRAVWWFNPVAWLLLRPMRTDMEAACDAAVVRTMDRKQKLRYANLLLELGEENG